MSVQIGPATAAGQLEIETNTRALRATFRPPDIGSLGSYKLAGVSGVMAAGLGAGAPIFSWRYGGSNTALIKCVLFGAVGLGTAFAAGSNAFAAFIARSFTASDSGGTSILPTLNKMATGMATSGLADARISSTATLSAGTRTLDGQPVGQLLGVASATVSQVVIPPQTPIFDARPGEWPAVFAQNEGLVIQATVAATGTWSFSVQIEWDEVSLFGAGLAV